MSESFLKIDDEKLITYIKMNYGEITTEQLSEIKEQLIHSAIDAVDSDIDSWFEGELA